MVNLPIKVKHMALAEEFMGPGGSPNRRIMLANFIAGYPDGTPDRLAKAVQDHLLWDEKDAAEVQSDYDDVFNHTGSRNNMDGTPSIDRTVVEISQARVHLDYPVDIDGTPVESVVVNRPTGRTLQLWSDNMAEYFAMLASDLTGWPLDVTMDLAYADVVAIRGVYQHFRFSPLVAPGASGDETVDASKENTNGIETQETKDVSIV